VGAAGGGGAAAGAELDILSIVKSLNAGMRAGLKVKRQMM